MMMMMMMMMMMIGLVGVCGQITCVIEWKTMRLMARAQGDRKASITHVKERAREGCDA